MKIGVYGGTFNPIHTGHMAAAKFAVEYLQLDLLYLIPAGLPPHKTLAEDTPQAEHRLNMTKLAAGAIGKNVKALDIELRRTGKSYTLDTLRSLRAEHPEDELYFFMGTDMFLTFHRWYKPEEIAALCTICAFGRSEADTEELFAVQREYLQRTLDASVITLTLPQIVEISSTQLREKLQHGGGKEYLHPAVYGYILREGLYGVKCDLKNLELSDLRCVALSMLAPGRVPHVLGTEETAAKLAVRWGVDEETARRAALLHDCTKLFSREQHYEFCRQYNREVDVFEQQEEQLLHAKTGAILAEQVFGASEDISQAILYHTTGKADMTTLEKIIYLADYIEPTRSFRDLTELRALAMEDLDSAMLAAFTMSVDHLKEKGGVIHPNSLSARDFLRERNAQS
ncbi:MAG: nicotinate (nicotinamide) nucleotide adenylyltransferase [Oscillospiraceae bacterium]|nr:nicotinate (nicotinamide) nucleotide adenylyltransferase [Oscillospiraceae bacterium]